MSDFDPGWNIIDVKWWMPHWLRHLAPLLPPNFPHWTHFWVAIPLAIVITIIRLYVSDPIATRICVYRLGLEKTSLRQRMASEQGKNENTNIPKWILDQIDGFAQDMLILKKKLKKKKFTPIQIRVEKQQRWKEFTAQVIASAADGTKEGGTVTQSQLNSWWGTIKKDSARTLELMKFNEAFWRFGFYTFIWIYGIWVGLRESWLTDMYQIWAGWPLEQGCSTEVRWYYYLSFGHYIHLFVTQFFEPKRKDWWEMFIHHIVTMALIFFSYIVNFTRIGVVVLLCHDGSDIFLELAKLFNYMKMSTLCDVTFSIFALAFFIGRLVMYPWRVIYVAIVLGSEQVGIWRGWYIFVGLLLVLQILHIFWFYTIACMVYSFVATGNVEKDVREETESEPEEVTGQDSTKLEADHKVAPEKAAIKEKEDDTATAAAASTDENDDVHPSRGQELKKRTKKADSEVDGDTPRRMTRSQSRARA